MVFAGHCLDTALDAEVIYGSFQESNCLEVFALRTWTHPGLSRDVDIGLLQTDDMSVRPIEVVSFDKWYLKNDPLQTQRQVKVCGWGLTEDQIPSKLLKCVKYTHYKLLNHRPNLW